MDDEYEKDLAALDAAVDEFAAAMKQRLRDKAAQGFHGWQTATKHTLAQMFFSCALKAGIHWSKVAAVDSANFAMMLYKAK